MESIFGNIDRTTLLMRGSGALSTLDAPLRRKSTGAASGAGPLVADQHFRLFNLELDLADSGRHVFTDPHTSKPVLAGGGDQPDVRARIELLAFNPGDIKVDDDSGRATLRLDVGQSKLASSVLNPLFWSIAAGLDLAAAAKTKSPDTPMRYRDNFDASFGQRPIEFPGGLAQIRFQVVAHPKEQWWQEIFSFLRSGAGDKLISALGFPGITSEAIKVVDQAFGVFQRPTILFKSDKMDFALSEYARRQYTMGMAGVEIGVLNRGFCLLAPQKYYDLIATERPKFLATFGRLLPAEWPAEKFGGADVNPFDAMPYAVLRINSETVALQGKLG